VDPSGFCKLELSPKEVKDANWCEVSELTGKSAFGETVPVSTYLEYRCVCCAKNKCELHVRLVGYFRIEIIPSKIPPSGFAPNPFKRLDYAYGHEQKHLENLFAFYRMYRGIAEVAEHVFGCGSRRDCEQQGENLQILFLGAVEDELEAERMHRKPHPEDGEGYPGQVGGSVFLLELNDCKKPGAVPKWTPQLRGDCQ
jgi:hypothetical protein